MSADDGAARSNLGPGAGGLAGLIGPVTRLCDAGQHVLKLRVGPGHLNPFGRLHGAMIMILQEMAMADAAQSASPAAGGHRLLPVTSHFEFLASAEEGDDIVARASVRRAGRSVVFVACELRSGDRLLSHASAVYGGTMSPAPDRAPDREPEPPPGFVDWVRPNHAFAQLAGPLLAGPDKGNVSMGALHVGTARADATPAGNAVGSVFLLADVFMTRAVYTLTGGRPVVTLTLSVNHVSEIRAGDTVVVEAKPEGTNGMTVEASAIFWVGDRKVLTAIGTWKIVEASRH